MPRAKRGFKNANRVYIIKINPASLTLKRFVYIGRSKKERLRSRKNPTP